MKACETQFQTQNTMIYFEQIAESSDRLYLLLHGYRQSGRVAFIDFASCFKESDHLVAPNAPYPILKSDTSILGVGYSWYFEDPKKEIKIKKREDAARAISDFLIQINPKKKPVTILGFSQGGILAFHVAELNYEVDQVIAVCSIFPTYPQTRLHSVKIHALHGENDSIIPLNLVQEKYTQFTQLGFSAELIVLPGLNHEVSDLTRSHIRDLIGRQKISRPVV